MKITIIGAGMAGLVAANMLRRHEVTILERNERLPHNHTALLRFRNLSVSDVTGVPFTRAIVRKGLWDGKKVINEPTLAHINRYSAIVTDGELHDRSVLNLAPAERWVAPREFVELMARDVNVMYNYDVDLDLIKQQQCPVISTVPMPIMMKMVEWTTIPEFRYRPVWTIKAWLAKPISTICQTLYNTEPEEWYRATIHGQEITLEFMFDPNPYNMGQPLKLVGDAFDRFFNHNHHCDSIVQDCVVNKIPIGKIRPIDDRIRKQFMLHLTEEYGIYSLGRFACWRNILLDDVVQDVKKIEHLMEVGHTYEMRKAL